MKLATLAFLAFAATDDCSGEEIQTKSSSGVSKATTTVQTQPNGRTVEQQNIIDRLKVDNTPGSIKHLYVISAYSGQVIVYSTVKGKVTSGSKRLTPGTVAAEDSAQYSGGGGIPFDLDGRRFYTPEVLGDDGAYGSSGDYIFWFDTNGSYHQHYNSGGQIVHVSDQPLAVKGVIINVTNPEATAPSDTSNPPAKEPAGQRGR